MTLKNSLNKKNNVLELVIGAPSYQNILLEIVREYETPLYVYDFKLMEESWELLRDAIPSDIDIFYSLKANPNLAVSAEFHLLGAFAEVCSLFELETALKAGFRPPNIIFVGPAKTPIEIQRCLELGIYAIICESPQEFTLISELAPIYNRKARVALRINPQFTAKDAMLKMGGIASQFGIDYDELLKNEEFFLKNSTVQLVGIHIYNGTRILNSYTIIENVRKILDLAEELSSRWSIKWEMVDIGGGIGVPYFEGEKPIDLDIISAHLKPMITSYLKNHPGTRIIQGMFMKNKL